MRTPDDLTPVLALDIDGVLGPTGRRPGESYAILPGVGWQGSIAYIPSIVERIQTLHASSRVEVLWLTSWEDEANEAWGQVGFGPFRTLRSREVAGLRWWKTEHVRRLLADGRRVIWIDDEIHEHLNLARPNPQPHRIHVVCPPSHIGLTHQDLEGAEAWLSRIKCRGGWITGPRRSPTLCCALRSRAPVVHMTRSPARTFLRSLALVCDALLDAFLR